MKNLSEHFTEKRSAYQRAPARAWTDSNARIEELFVPGEADISDRAMIWTGAAEGGRSTVPRRLLLRGVGRAPLG